MQDEQSTVELLHAELIVKAAMQKALDNGLDLAKFKNRRWSANLNGIPNNINIDSIIFYIDFAKAFWGEEKIDAHQAEIQAQQDKPLYNGTTYSQGIEIEAWKVNLQQMVLEEDPIKYLEQFLVL